LKSKIFARIDDRLIHGQVTIRWIPYLKADHVVIIDNELFANEFLKKVALAAAPKNIQTQILSEDKANDIISKLEGKILLLAKSPIVFKTLLVEGLKLERIILGGTGSRSDRKALYKNIFLSTEEVDAIKTIENLGIPVEIQMIPEDKTIPISKLI
jgi:mannose/fructose/N-acetylgalactosamine-specific phosphotransferase system component IIB